MEGCRGEGTWWLDHLKGSLPCSALSSELSLLFPLSILGMGPSSEEAGLTGHCLPKGGSADLTSTLPGGKSTGGLEGPCPLPSPPRGPQSRR